MDIQDFFSEKLKCGDYKPESPYERKVAETHLIPIISILLMDCGWEDDFHIMMDMNGKIILYLRIAYVAACSTEGTWEQIKAKIPELVEYAMIAKELRNNKDISLYWIDKSLKEVNWKNFAEMYR